MDKDVSKRSARIKVPKSTSSNLQTQATLNPQLLKRLSVSTTYKSTPPKYKQPPPQLLSRDNGKLLSYKPELLKPLKATKVPEPEHKEITSNSHNFYPDLLTTLPYELQMEILISLPYQTIINYCSTNKTAAVIRNDKGFWKRKARLEGLPDQLVEHSRLNYSQRYYDLSKYGSLFKDGNIDACLYGAILNADIDLVQYLIREYDVRIRIKTIINAMTMSVTNGYSKIYNLLFDVLSSRELNSPKLNFYRLVEELSKNLWIDELIDLMWIIFNFHPDVYHITLVYAVPKANRSILIKLVDNFLYDAEDYNEAFGEALYYNNAEAVDYLLELNPEAVDNIDISSISDINIIKVLLQHNYDQVEILRKFIRMCDWDDVNWFLSNITDIFDYNIVIVELAKSTRRDRYELIALLAERANELINNSE